MKSLHHTTSRKYQLLLTAVESISCQFCHIRNLFPKIIITVMKNKYMNKNERKGKLSGNKSQGFLEVVVLFRRASVTKAFEKLSWEEQITKGNKVENYALNV